MLTKAFHSALSQDLPVLFCYIGWTNRYDGTEPVIGSHGYLKTHTRETAEFRAFEKDSDGLFSCWIGPGKTPSPIHIVFVAADPASRIKKLVGVYARAMVEPPVSGASWVQARTHHATLIPTQRRPPISVWPGMQGIRRWAKSETSASHVALHKVFKGLKVKLPKLLKKGPMILAPTDQVYGAMEAKEGQQDERLVKHRKRESKLRRAKIKQMLDQNEGRLVCQVPGCGFDFYKRYGDLGYGYIHVHHRVPLAKIGKKKTTLDDLAIVCANCANCHAMIHRNGDCQNIGGLIPPRS